MIITAVGRGSATDALPVSKGGTGATTAAAALSNLGVTATAAELNKMDGVTATTAELNYVDGVTSNIQAQLDDKAATSHSHTATDINSGTLSSDRLPTVPIAKGGTGATTAAAALTNLGITATAAELNKLDGVTATATELNYVDGVTSNIQTQLNGKAASSHSHAATEISSGTLSSDRLPTVPVAKGGTGATTAAAALTNLGLTATAAELNVLDGITATTAELNYMDGVTSAVQTQLNGKAASSHNHAATNITSGTLSSDRLPTVPIAKGGTGATTAAAALTNLGITATAAELNKLDGVTATTAELNYVDGVTSNIQTQLNAKAAADHTHDGIKGESIFYIEGTGSTAGTWLGSHADITAYYDGLIVAYKIPVAGASTTTLDINSLGAVKVVRNVTTAVSTNYAVQAVLILTYTTDTSGTAYWKVADYDANTYVRVYRQKGSSYNGDYPLIASRTKAASLGTVGTESSQEGVYGLISDTNANIPTTNPYTGETKVKTLTVSGTVTASSFVGAAATTSAAGLMSADDKTKLNGIAEGANAYSLPTASSSTLGGIKVGSNLSISSGTLSVPNATDTMAGVTIVYPEAKCTTFTSDSGTVTPAAIKKAVSYLSRLFDNGSTAQKDLPHLKWKTMSSNTPYIGYATDQTDGTFVIGSLKGTNYASGLAIGGGSGNLLWKGTKVATTSDIPSLTGYTKKSTQTTATLSASSWSGSSAPYTYTLTVSGVTATSVVELVETATCTAAQLEALQAANICNGSQTTNSITLRAFGTKPTINLPILIIVRGDL